LKRKLTILLVVLMILGSVAYAAQENFTILLNGTPLKSDISPQVVNGQILVPVQTIAEAIGANIRYDNLTNIIYINTKEESKLPIFAQLTERYWIETNLEPPPIEGLDEFKEIISKALELLKNKCPNEYKVVCASVDIIKLDELDKANEAVANTDGSITFNKNSYEKIWPTWKKDLVIKRVASTLVHESTHMQQFASAMWNPENTRFTEDDIEVMAYLAQYRTAGKIGLSRDDKKEMWNRIKEYLKQ